MFDRIVHDGVEWDDGRHVRADVLFVVHGLSGAARPPGPAGAGANLAATSPWLAMDGARSAGAPGGVRPLRQHDRSDTRAGRMAAVSVRDLLAMP